MEVMVMGEVTGGDLYALWRVSEALLPRVADVYYDANRLVAADSSAAGLTFALTMWNTLKDELQDMYADIGGVVLDGATGVREARLAYEATDAGAAQGLQVILKDPYRNSTDPSVAPPAPGSEDDPGAPVVVAQPGGVS
jgi:ABC-type transporter Mla MlaB component